MMKFKILFIIPFIIFITIASIECILRVAGYFYYNKWLDREKEFIEKEGIENTNWLSEEKIQIEGTNLIRIICLGDSCTFGTGARPGYSYPAQLQRTLDEERPNRFKVYNCGIPGLTSYKLLKYLPKLTEKYKPNIFVILIGINDFANPDLSDSVFLLEGRRSICYRMKSFVRDLRIYKVLTLGLIGRKKKTSGQPAYLGNNIGIRPTSGEYEKIGYDLYTSGEVERAKKYFEDAISIDPNNERAYLRLGHLYSSLRQYERALVQYGQILKINPYSPLRSDLYRFLFFMYQENIKNSDIRNKISSLVEEIPSDDIFTNPGPPFIPDLEKVSMNFKNNIESIVNLVRANKGILIFQTYLHEVSPSVNVSVEKYEVFWVNNRKSLEGSKNPNDYFAADGHPNASGYKIMAQNVFEVVKNIDSIN